MIAREPAPQLHRPRRVPAHRRDLAPLPADAPQPLPRHRRARRARRRLRRLLRGRDARRAGDEVALEDRPREGGQADDRPNLVYGADVHVVWDKFCRYFDVEPRQVTLAKGNTVEPTTSAPRIDENTIGVVAVVGTTFTGECDDVAGIDEMLRELAEPRPRRADARRRRQRRVRVPVLGSRFRVGLPPALGQVDQRLGPQVRAGVPRRRLARLPRRARSSPRSSCSTRTTSGEKDATFTLNFSGSSSFILAQYYMFIRPGGRATPRRCARCTPTPTTWPRGSAR